MLKLFKKKEPAYIDLENYDYSAFARDMTEEELLTVNGGRQIANTNEAVANAKPGDTLTRSDNTTVVITEGDIKWAQEQVGSPSTTSNTTSTEPNSSTSSTSSEGSNDRPKEQNNSPSSVGSRVNMGAGSLTVSDYIAQQRKKGAGATPAGQAVEVRKNEGQAAVGKNAGETVDPRNRGFTLTTDNYPDAYGTGKIEHNEVKPSYGLPSDIKKKLEEREENKKNQLYKQRDLEIKYGYPYGAPEYGSLCLATSIINLYVKEYSISPESVDRVMREAKGKYISDNGTVLDMEGFSKRLAEECDSERYFDYVYYNPSTKKYEGAPREFTKNEFLESKYDYAIGGYYHEGASALITFSSVSHYEMIQKTPYMENNPGVGQYELYKIRPVGSYKM